MILLALRFGRRLHEYFFLAAAERRVAALDDAQRTTVRTHFDAAMRTLQAAQDLREGGQGALALPLYRRGLLLLAVAFLVARDPDYDANAPAADVLRALEQSLASGAIALGARLRLDPEVLLTRDPLELDRLPPPAAQQAARDIEAACLEITALIDPRSPREVKLSRWTRLGTTATVLVAVTIALIAWALAPANLALHKPATSSSSGFDTTPSGATDGDKFTRFGFHSAEEDSPWLSIDLQRPYEISAVKIYGRGDCCFDQSVPLALEVSDDGTTYRQIAERTQSFSQSDPWIVRPDRTLARFVRLHVMRRSYLVVSEVVVNGRSPK